MSDWPLGGAEEQGADDPPQLVTPCNELAGPLTTPPTKPFEWVPLNSIWSGPPHEGEEAKPYGPSGPMPLEPGTLEGMNMHLAVLGLPPLKEAWDNPPLAREVHNILAAAKPVLLARLAATTGAEMRTMLERVGQEIGVYGVQTSVTGDLAPHSDLTDALRAVEQAFAALQQRAEEAERDHAKDAESQSGIIADYHARLEATEAALTEARRAAREECAKESLRVAGLLRAESARSRERKEPESALLLIVRAEALEAFADTIRALSEDSLSRDVV